MESHIVFPLQEWQQALAALLLLYAEIHYRFKIAPSLLYQRRPEIIADAPHRLDPQQPLPILILIKDAHLFPIEVRNITAEISGSRFLKFQLFNTTEQVASQWWWRVFHVRLPEEMRGSVFVNVVIEYRCRGKILRCCNDNYRGTSHAPLQVFVADAPLPTLPGFYCGDLHCHTNATSDQVEYGAPLPAMIEMAKTQGLSFFAATDHSYDLDDFLDDYLHNDPELHKWHNLQSEVRRLNHEHRDFVIIPGEEVSCGNARGENVHFLVLNHPRFIRGRGDGGEKWLHTKPDHTLNEVLDMLDANALAFAAHPYAPVPILERKLLRRGNWSAVDFSHARLHGLQFWNGKNLGEEEGFEQWRKLLMEGRKLFAVAGNDAHGNFNRYRQVAWPCLSMAEHHDHLFGVRRTAVKLREPLSLDALLAALRNGRAIITTGPILDLQVQCEDGTLVEMGETVSARFAQAVLTARSTPEFGKLERVDLWRGDWVNNREECFFRCVDFPQPYECNLQLPLPHSEGDYYLRAQAVTTGGRSQPARAAKALSNPIWIKA